MVLKKWCAAWRRQHRTLCAQLFAAAVLGTAVLATTGTAGCSRENAAGTLLVAHAHNAEHPVYAAFEDFCSNLEKNDNLKCKIYPLGQLGGNTDMIQMVRAGVLDIAKVSASNLEQFNSSYAVFSLPYVFKSREHYFNVMEHSKKVQEIFRSTAKQGFIAIGWYDGGQRSVYTVKKPVHEPSDLKGLKIRTQDSPTSIAMMAAMGGAATPIANGETYSSLQQGIIDGAENCEIVLADDGHGEVAKYYSYTEHQMVPDIVIMSEKSWNKLTPEQQKGLLEAQQASTKKEIELMKDVLADNIRRARDMGVQFIQPDKEAFIKACAPMLTEFAAKSPENAAVLADFESYNTQDKGE